MGANAEPDEIIDELAESGDALACGVGEVIDERRRIDVIYRGGDEY